MTDRIFVSDLCLFGHHGVTEEERKAGQDFFLDIEVQTDARLAAKQDNQTGVIGHRSICEIAQEVSDAGSFPLIETLAERLIAAIFDRFPAAAGARVRIRQSGTSIPANPAAVGVELTRSRQRQVGFSLGSNVGEKSSQIRAALAFLEAVPGIEITAVSQLYRTAPWGKLDQDWFVNACAVGQTNLTAYELLRAVKEIEVALGRTPGERWGPRLIDIDLLYLGDEEISSTALSLPHPEMLNRGFVLVPLAEIAGDVVVFGQRIADAARTHTTKDDGVEVYLSP